MTRITLSATVTTALAGALAVAVVATGTAWASHGADDSRPVEAIAVTATTVPTAVPTAGASLEPGDDSPRTVRVDDDPTTTSRPTKTSRPTSTRTTAVPQGVTAAQARSIAVALRPGTVRKSELEQEHGSTVWKVEVDGDDGNRWRIQIDAVSGDVLEVERH